MTSSWPCCCLCDGLSKYGLGNASIWCIMRWPVRISTLGQRPLAVPLHPLTTGKCLQFGQCSETVNVYWSDVVVAVKRLSWTPLLICLYPITGGYELLWRTWYQVYANLCNVHNCKMSDNTHTKAFISKSNVQFHVPPTQYQYFQEQKEEKAYILFGFEFNLCIWIRLEYARRYVTSCIFLSILPI